MSIENNLPEDDISLNFEVSFRWDDCFLTGLHEIDEQHRQLVAVINRYGKLVTESEQMPLDEIEKVFHDLAEYAKYHFKEEESFMRNFFLDERHLQDHCKEHNNFLLEVLQIKKGFSAGHQNATRSLLQFLIHWLAYHILGSDQSLARQIFAIEKNISPAEAFEQEQINKRETMGPLVRALNGLVHQISERNRQLNMLNQTLETKVQQRTQSLQEANRRLEHLAMTDLLTGLPNRRHAMKALNESWTQSLLDNSPLSCLLVDADNFKEINDSSGHDAGDLILQKLSQKLRESVRTDDLVCRLGGDEFIIICQRTPLLGAMLLAEKIIKEVNAMKIEVLHGAWLGSVSIGAASKEKGMSNVEQLLKMADDGVYIAKRQGRNQAATAQKKTNLAN